ncbi:unnamed protein product [Symbiodinium necroappetens]|uniref:Thiolase-like protein type 1 additional C-terminal domain-containing protein n=1 Tax=Symbiodinium necroappetens TaxID=1628268 RepID=A0A812QU43_9DINO|nr:unnamed protein product [Symbiodinium necroappetens]
MSVAETTPVVVGVARYTHRIQHSDLSDALTPLQLLERTVTRALQDATLKGADIDCVATMEFWHEMLVPPKTPKHYPNPPKSVATLIGASEAIEKNHLYAHPTGGNGPQELINILGEMISTSKIRSAVICGAEGLAALKKGLAAGMSLPGVTEMRRKLSDKNKSQIDTSGKELPWGDDPGGEPQRFLKSEGMAAYVTRRMVQTGLVDPTVAYAIFEQAYRKECYPNVSREQYQRELARLMSEFSQLAAADPANAWDPQVRTPEQIATPGPGNRYVAFPYTRAMNSFIDVDQSAAVVLMSLGEARRRGVPEEKFVFLHAHSDVTEEPYRMLDRPDFTVSPALRVIRHRLEETLGEPLSGIKHKEIYSCFPVAVRHAALQLGIPFLHASDICKTGGMQFHGGPGNNFSTHSIALMVEILRKDPGSKGLVTSNGGIFSKHSAGVYSTQPCTWVPRHVEEDQARAKQLLAKLHPVPVKMNDQPSGEATVDLWTVVFDVENKPKRAIIIGTLTATSERFIAASTLAALTHLWTSSSCAYGSLVQVYDPM